MCRGPACLTFILLAFSALGVPRERALAEPPRGTTPETRSNPADGTLPREPPRLELSLLFENDNKFLGLWGVFAEDGHDVGRTHGMFFSIVRPLRSGVRLEIELGSELFSAQLYDEDGGRLNLGRDGLPNPDSYEDRNLYFNELSWLVARARGVLPREPRLAWVLGGGLVISNR
ncbi:MAG: hypothetical protein H5U40_13705, partial [Polyangiaceae bacterium]|nr:hypothetical protein [Polyangiaceae bacterium]